MAHAAHRPTKMFFRCLASLWAIKSFQQTSITFPLMLDLMIGVRKLMEKVFKAEELEQLDDPIPEFHTRKKEEAKKKKLLKEKQKVRKSRRVMFQENYN